MPTLLVETECLRCLEAEKEVERLRLLLLTERAECSQVAEKTVDEITRLRRELAELRQEAT
jgi:hypothetical protein